MKKFYIQAKIGLLMTFAVILLSATCYIAYRNLSSIVASIQSELSPELRLFTIRDISGDLETADNSIRMYIVTRDRTDLRNYYTIIEGIDEKVNRLREECLSDSVLLSQADTVSTLIEENLVIWNELLYVIDRDNAGKYLDSLYIKTSSAAGEKEKKGILKRVFARSEKEQQVENEIITGIKEIEEQNRLTAERIRAGQEQLAITSGRIKEKFFDLITRMEYQASVIMSQRGEAANRLARKTYLWLILFSASGGILAIIVLLIIVRYIRRTHEYQQALERSKRETENLARTRELFVANITHEIRTPVTAISGFTEQLISETADENVLQSLKIIKSSSDHLAKIIDDILDLSKLNSGKLALENVDFSINQIFEEVYTIFERQAIDRNTVLKYSVSSGTPSYFAGDPWRIRQILINLVGNAVKFTRNGEVSFTASGSAGDDGSAELLIEVTDTGIGMDEEEQKIIFDDFSQAEMSITRRYGGTGLGLSIVKKLVDLHHGNLECHSKKNQGTRMSCNLPLRAGSEKQAEHDAIVPIQIPLWIKNLSVLVVDDEEYNRLLFKKIFDRWKVKCDLANNGMDAIEVLKERKYDILFIDMRMPGIDGIKTTQFIRKELGIGEECMKVICISAFTLADDWAKYSEAGMNAYLQKPFTEEKLLSAILSVKGDTPQRTNDYPSDRELFRPEENHDVSLKNLYHISGGDEMFVKQMLISFNKTTGEGLKELKGSLASGDPQSVAAIAHRLIPPCRHVGANELCSILTEIEAGNSKQSNTGTIEELVNRASNEYEKVRTILERHISGIN